ncbi:MAG: DUF1287 domain-containing protein [Gammaproteobacteria bacterium]|nr:DUF1287 domain-containing protein [Gammaproteobacteria bacterium]MDH5801372.1 DUF1287 domain-containing protein [Gammaproteobacteria bacterium]
MSKLRVIRIIKKLSVLLVIVLPLVWYSVSYKGPKRFTNGGTELPPLSQVVAHARSLTGTLYDPFMGQHDNIGGRLGFIVCSDVPNIAYGLAGLSLEVLLRRDFTVHTAHYDSGGGNKPGNPYFHRRARNLYAYFKANQRLYKDKPRVGDLAFYKKAEDKIITHVVLVSEVKGNRFKVMESAPKTLVASENDSASPIQRGWVFMGFGRMYP